MAVDVMAESYRACMASEADQWNMPSALQLKQGYHSTRRTQHNWRNALNATDRIDAMTDGANDCSRDTPSFMINSKLLGVCFLKYSVKFDLFLFIYFIRRGWLECVLLPCSVQLQKQTTERVAECR